MTTQVRFVVPVTTTSLFLIVADRPPSPFAPAAQDGPLPGAVVWAAHESPFDVRQVWRFANWEDPLPPPSAYHVVVWATAPISDQPRVAQHARAYARVLAAQNDGVLIDWATREAVVAARRPERARFHLGDQWLSFEFVVYEDRHAEIAQREPWDDEPRADDACAANRIQTCGLARFGLPELEIDGVDCEHHLTAVNVLRTLAQHLLTEHWAWLSGRAALPGRAVTRRIAARQQVTGTTFAAYWGASWPPDNALAASLTVSGRLLQVHAPCGGRLNDWLAGIWTYLRSLAGCRPDDFEAYAELLPRS